MSAAKRNGTRTKGRKGAPTPAQEPSKEVLAERKLKKSGPLGKMRVYLKMLGPGLITGASDDDPSGIGTYSQAGAQFGFATLWTALFTFPLMAGIQEICARIALSTGRSLTELIGKHYPKPVLYLCVLLLFVANTVNLGADLGAMAAACRLLVGLPFQAWLVAITVCTILLQVFLQYKSYAKVLRLLTLSLLTYVLLFFVIPMDWRQLLRATVVPHVEFKADFLLTLVAILGTTISPYLFFWQTNIEIDEKIAEGKGASPSRPAQARAELKWMRTDVISGMLFSNFIMYCIVASGASSFFMHGIRKIDTAQQAAKMLEPIAGHFASLLFAMGIVGTGLLAVPILAGSAAYAVAETFHLKKGLYRTLREAPGFYGIIVLATFTGLLLDLLGIDPVKALYYAAVLNGLAAPPLLVMVMLISRNDAIMHGKVNTPISSVLGWLTTAAMTLSALGLLLAWGR